MTTQSELLREWQVRLEQGDAVENEAAGRRHIFTRVLRFLLRCYSNVSWTTVPKEQATASTLHIEAIDVTTSSRPKSAATIKTALCKLLVDRRDSPLLGPLTAGLAERAPLCAASFRYRWFAERFTILLTHEGIPSQAVRRGGRSFIEVPRDQFDRAVAVYDRHKQQLLNESLYRPSSVFLGTAAMLAGTFYGVVATLSLEAPAARGLWLLIGAAGASLVAGNYCLHRSIFFASVRRSLKNK